MLIQLLGWTGSALLATGLYKVGNQEKNGWFFSMAGESIWIIKGALMGMWDLTFICVIFLVLAIRAYRSWNTVQAQDYNGE